MLSLYDAFAFSTQKKCLFCGVLFATFMLMCLVFVGCSLEVNFSLFSAFKTWLVTPSKSIQAIHALSQIALTLESPFFWGLVFQKLSWIVFVFFLITFIFFAFELVISKKTLFKQPDHFSISFFVVSLGKLLLLWLPVLLALYFYLQGVIKSALAALFGFITGLSSVYVYPFPVRLSIVFATLAFLYLLYVISLFIERFSFVSLLKPLPFFKHLKTVIELVLNIAVLKITLLLGWAVLFSICWNIDSLWFCFGALMGYLIWMAVLNSARFVFVLPFVLIGIGGVLIQAFVGSAFFQQYLFVYMIGSLVFFTAFLFWSMFIAVLAHLFAQTAFVFRFDRTAARDIKKKSPQKLRRIEELYDTYLKEHHNDTQDNFFNHMEEKENE